MRVLGATALRATVQSACDRTADSEVPTATGAEPWAAPHRPLESLGAWDLAPSPIAELIAHDDDDEDNDDDARGGLVYLAVDGTVGALRVGAETLPDEY